MQQLAKNDQLICKDLTVSIIYSLIEMCKQTSKHDDFTKKFVDRIKYIIENEQDSNSTITAILEILWTTSITDCSPEIIARISRSNSLNFLGSLVLEENLIHNVNIFEPPKKKIQSEIMSDSSSEWLQLINLYKSMNDIDVVLSIFQNHITNEDIQVFIYFIINIYLIDHDMFF